MKAWLELRETRRSLAVFLLCNGVSLWFGAGFVYLQNIGRAPGITFAVADPTGMLMDPVDLRADRLRVCPPATLELRDEWPRRALRSGYGSTAEKPRP